MMQEHSLSSHKTIDIGNNKTIKVQSLQYYLKKRSNLIRLRVKFLVWEVDIELAEAVSGYAVWAVMTDITNLIFSKAHNQIYDVLFKILPAWSWVIIAAFIAFVHLTAILFDKSCEPEFDYKEPKALQYLFARSRMMFLSFVFNFCVVLSVVVGHSYVLVWKYQILFVIASLLSYIRLNKQYTDFVKLKKRANADAVSSHTD